MKSQLNNSTPRSGTKRAAIVATEVLYKFKELFAEFGAVEKTDSQNPRRACHMLETTCGPLEISTWASDFAEGTASGGFFLFCRFTGTDEQVQAAVKTVGCSPNGKWNQYVNCNVSGVDNTLGFFRWKLPYLLK